MSTPDANVAIQDPHRQRVLREMRILDTPAEECFDRLTRMAASLLHVPATYIAFVDETRDFCKSGYGLPSGLAEKREIAGDAFCRNTVAHNAPLVIPNTSAHAFSGRIPAVTSMSVAAFVGVPITIDGTAIGAFCAIDFVTRTWSDTDVKVLEELVRSVVRELELQRALRMLQENAETARAVRAPEAASDAQRERIVIAEDDASMRRLMVRTLTGDGYEVVEAIDGRETLEALRRNHTALLILDLVMPEISGWDVLDARSNEATLRNVPVIVVSAKRGPDVARALAYGVYGLLPKPFDPDDLRDLVKTCFTEQRGP